MINRMKPVMGRLLGVIVVQTQAEAVRFGRRHRKQAVPDPTLCFVYLYLLYVINNYWLSFPFIPKLVPVYDCHSYALQIFLLNKEQMARSTWRGSTILPIHIEGVSCCPGDPLGLSGLTRVHILYSCKNFVHHGPVGLKRLPSVSVPVRFLADESHVRLAG